MKHLYDIYLASRDALLSAAAEEFKKLAGDAELVDALAWINQTTPDFIRKALANPQSAQISLRYNGVGEAIGIDYVVMRQQSRRHTLKRRWRRTEIPLELLTADAGAFAQWREERIAQHRREAEQVTDSIIRSAKNALAAYRRLPESVRAANPVPGVKR